MRAPERLAELAPHQQDKVRELFQKSEQQVAVAIQRCYRHLFVPSRNNKVEGALVRKGISEDSPGRLVPIDGSAVAFMPNPMRIELALGQGEIRLLSEADYAIGRLTGSAGRLVNPYLIGQPLLRREAILSSRIEGTLTTPEQLVLLEAGVAPASQDARVAADTREVLNYVRAMERGLELLKTIPVSLLHDLRLSTLE